MASETVCGGRSRQRHVMLSESHDVEVRMVLQSRRDEPTRYVLVRYEGKQLERIDWFVLYNTTLPSPLGVQPVQATVNFFEQAMQ